GPGGIYQVLGQLSMRIKEYVRGIEYLEKAVHLNPDLSAAYFLIGIAYAEQQQFDTSMDQDEKVLKTNRKAVQPLMMVGMLHDKNGEEKLARESVQKAVALGQNFPEAAEAKKLLESLGSK